MPELHPGPEVSLGMLEAQLRDLGLAYNVGYFLTVVDGHWALSVNEENYKRWQEAKGVQDSEDSEEPEDGEEKKSSQPAEPTATPGKSTADSAGEQKPPARPATRRPAKKGR